MIRSSCLRMNLVILEIMTDRPTDQLTDRRTDGLIGKINVHTPILHFSNLLFTYILDRVSDPHFLRIQIRIRAKIFMRIRILGVSGGKGKNDFFLVFFTFQMILNNGCLKSEQKK